MLRTVCCYQALQLKETVFSHRVPCSVVVTVRHLRLDNPLVPLRKSLHKPLNPSLRKALVRHSLFALDLALNTNDDSNLAQKLATRHDLASSVKERVQLDQRPLSQHQTQPPDVLPAPRELEHPICPEQRSALREAGTPQPLIGSRLAGLFRAANKCCGLPDQQEGVQRRSGEASAHFSQVVVSIAQAAVDESGVVLRSYAAVGHDADGVFSWNVEDA
jgi:hypothetical protein